MRKLIASTAIASMAVWAFSVVGVASAASPSYSLFGDASIVSPGNASNHAASTTSSSSTAPGYGGVDFTTSAPVTVSNLNNLGTDFMVTAGMCAGGSPRFALGTSEGNIFVYLGTPPNYTCLPGTWVTSGNLFTPTSLIDDSQLPGGTFYDTVAAAQARYGDLAISDIALVTDGSWVAGNDPQTVEFDNVMINSDTYTFEPNTPTTMDQCKKGGWQNFTDANFNAFKNQGDCVSYVATNGKNQGAGQ